MFCMSSILHRKEDSSQNKLCGQVLRSPEEDRIYRKISSKKLHSTEWSFFICLDFVRYWLFQIIEKQRSYNATYYHEAWYSHPG